MPPATHSGVCGSLQVDCGSCLGLQVPGRDWAEVIGRTNTEVAGTEGAVGGGLAMHPRPVSVAVRIPCWEILASRRNGQMGGAGRR